MNLLLTFIYLFWYWVYSVRWFKKERWKSWVFCVLLCLFDKLHKQVQIRWLKKLNKKIIHWLYIFYNLQITPTFHSVERLVNLVGRRECFVGLFILVYDWEPCNTFQCFYSKGRCCKTYRKYKIIYQTVMLFPPIISEALQVLLISVTSPSLTHTHSREPMIIDDISFTPFGRYLLYNGWSRVKLARGHTRL